MSVSSSNRAISCFSKNAEMFAAKFLANTKRKEHFVYTLRTYLPKDNPLTILDLGAGSGDAAAILYQDGHVVTAVEPCFALRQIGEERYSSLPLQWVDDRLPTLSCLSGREEQFDLVLAQAVLMFMSEPERRESYKRITQMVKKNGLIAVINKYTEMEPERGAYPLPPDEIENAAKNLGWELLFSGTLPSLKNETDWWRGYIFRFCTQTKQT